MKYRGFSNDRGSLLTYVAVSLIVSVASAVTQLYLYLAYVRDLLPVGWGGIVGPFAVPAKTFVLTLPATGLVLLFWQGSYGAAMKDWKFWAAYFIPLSILLCLLLAITHPLDGGGTLLSRFFSR